MKISSQLLLLCFCAATLCGYSRAPQNDTIQVGYVGSAPFVIQSTNGAQPEGIVFDVWEEIAFSLNRQYKLQAVPSINLGISAINSGKIDLLIGPITINSNRAAKVSFSQPFFDTELALLAPVKELSFWGYLTPFFPLLFCLLFLVCC